MSIFVISDLHRGTGGNRECFDIGDRENQLSLFLDYVEANAGALYTIGDLFEGWMFSMGGIISKHTRFLDRLAAMGARYILGNHDGDLAGMELRHPFLQQPSTPFEATIGEKKFWFMHGHELDTMNSNPLPSWGRIFAIIGGLTMDYADGPIIDDNFLCDDLQAMGDFALSHLSSMFGLRFHRNLIPKEVMRSLTPAQNSGSIKQIINAYAADRTNRGVDIVVSGHLHVRGHVGDWYFNSGTWARKVNSFLEISDSGEVAVFDWVNGVAVPYEGTVI